MGGTSRYSGIRYAMLLGLTVLGLVGCSGGGGIGSFFPGLTSWSGSSDPPDPPSINLSSGGPTGGTIGNTFSTDPPPNDPPAGDPPLSATPEPPTGLLLGTGAAAIAYLYRSMRARRRDDD